MAGPKRILENILGDEVWNLLQLCDIKRNSAGLFLSMLVDKLLQLILSPAYNNDGTPLFNKARGKCFPNARSGSDDQDFFVLKRHNGTCRKGLWFSCLISVRVLRDCLRIEVPVSCKRFPRVMVLTTHH